MLGLGWVFQCRRQYLRRSDVTRQRGMDVLLKLPLVGQRGAWATESDEPRLRLTLSER